jgi:hypothetical protein
MMRAIGLRLGLDGESTPKWFQMWPRASAAATNNESAVDRGVLWTETFHVVGVLGEDVTCAWLAMANWRAADRSRVRRTQ